MWTMGVVKRPPTPSAASADETVFMGGADPGDDVVFADGAAFAGRVASADEAELLDEVEFSDAVAFPVIFPAVPSPGDALDRDRKSVV